MNPYTDYDFKKLFGTEENKELLIGFLNAMIFDREGIITDLTYKNIEQLGDNKDRRNCYFDVYCETQDGSLFYAAKPIRDQAEKGEEWDSRLNNVYMVGVMNFRFPNKEYPEDSYYHVIQLVDVVDQHVFYDNSRPLALCLAKPMLHRRLSGNAP